MSVVDHLVKFARKHAVHDRAIDLAMNLYGRNGLDELTDKEATEVGRRLREYLDRTVKDGQPPRDGVAPQPEQRVSGDRLPPDLQKSMQEAVDTAQERRQSSPPQQQFSGPVNANGNPIKFQWPTTGKELYSWCFAIADAYGNDPKPLINHEFIKNRKWPSFWRDWSNEQVQAVALWTAENVSTWEHYDGQFDDRLKAGGTSGESVETITDKIQSTMLEIMDKNGLEATDSNMAATLKTIGGYQSVRDANRGQPVGEHLHKITDRIVLQALLHAAGEELKMDYNF